VRDAAAFALRSAPRAIAEPALVEALRSEPHNGVLSYSLQLVRARVR
jgi:hypothetical protein